MRFSAFSITCLAAVLILSNACDTTSGDKSGVSPTPVAAVPPKPLPQPGLTPRQRFSAAINLLGVGEAEKARAELEAYLIEFPKSQRAKDLISQIDADPVAVLGKESVAYRLKPGESLSAVARDRLGDRFKFYLLARYNDISNPSSVAAGQVIRVPGRSVAQKPPNPPQVNPDKPDKDVTPPPGRVPAPPVPPVVVTPPPPDPKKMEAKKIDELMKEAKALSASRDHDGAVNLLEEGLIEFVDSDRIRKALIAALLTRAKELVARQDYANALAALQRARELAPDNRDVARSLAQIDRQKRSNELYKVGVRYRKAGANIEAFDAQKEALNAWPDNNGAQREYAALKPTVVRIFFQEGMSALARQKLVEAMKQFDRALEIDPDNDDVKLQRVRAKKLCDKIKERSNSTSCAAS